MGEKIKEMQELPETPQPMPNITPEMLQTTFKLLESHGMIYYDKSRVYVPTEKGWKLLMNVKSVREKIIAYGHPNIIATNDSIIKITKSENLENEVDSVIGVKSNKSCKDLKEEFKEALKKGKKVEMILEVEGVEDKIIAYGSPVLELTDDKEIVIRKSDFVDSRTLAILADKAANQLNRRIIEKLKNPGTEVRISLEIRL